MLDSRPDTFDERNLFLHGLLGLLSLGRRLDAALAVPAPPSSTPVAADDPWLLCVLGAVAFRQRLGALVAEAHPDVARPTEAPASAADTPLSPASAPGPSLREILR